MAKVARGIEQEIERARGDSRWDDIPKLFKELDFSKSSLSESYKGLVECELQVEKLFSEYRLEANLDEPLKAYLSKLKGNLHKLYEDAREKKFVVVETLFLICKVNYMLREYDATLKCITMIEEDSNNFDGYKRRLKMTADMFAIKGIVLEELQSSSMTHITDGGIIECFDTATNTFLKMLVAADSKTSLPRSPSVLNTSDYTYVGQPLEVAFQHSNILNIRHGHTDKAIERLRYFVRNLEQRSLQNLREILIEQLVTVLLHGVSDHSYIMQTNILPPSPSGHSFDSSSSHGLKTSLSDNSLFVPHNITEDVTLLLLLKETMVLQKATSSVSPEETSSRELSVSHANCIYNLLSVALVRHGQFSLLAECLERAMKLAFEEFHLWFQFGLALANAQKFAMAVLVLKQCHELQPENPMVLLHAIKICYNNFHQFDEGVEMSERVVQNGANSPFFGKCYLALGIGYCGQANTVLTNREKQNLYAKAIQAFEKCLGCDPEDKEALFHLALTQALLRKITKALRNAYAALKLDCNYLFALQLIVLLLSAKKKYREALDACDTALLEYPDDFILLLIKVKVEEVWLGGDQALTTCKRLLSTWKRLYENDFQSLPMMKKAGSGLIDKIVSDKRSLKNMQLTELEVDHDETSSIGASVRLESTLSEEAGSLSVCQLSLPAALGLQARIWLAIADVYINLSKESEASACVKEANLVFPLSPDVFFQQGKIYEKQENFTEAKRSYENAISINPNHSSALQHLGIIYYKMKNYTMSERVLREAINTDPTLHLSWHNLGVVLQAQDHHEAASECLMTAIDLETTSPIVPFTNIARIM